MKSKKQNENNKKIRIRTNFHNFWKVNRNNMNKKKSMEKKKFIGCYYIAMTENTFKMLKTRPPTWMISFLIMCYTTLCSSRTILMGWHLMLFWSSMRRRFLYLTTTTMLRRWMMMWDLKWWYFCDITITVSTHNTTTNTHNTTTTASTTTSTTYRTFNTYVTLCIVVSMTITFFCVLYSSMNLDRI